MGTFSKLQYFVKEMRKIKESHHANKPSDLQTASLALVNYHNAFGKRKI